MNLENFVNLFTEEDFIKDSSGLSVLKDKTLIFSKLREISPLGYEWEITEVGPDTSYVVIKLTLRDGEDTITVPGAADQPPSANLGVSGLATLALTNAVLRNLGMAEFLYKDERTADERYTQPVPQQTAPAPAQASGGDGGGYTRFPARGSFRAPGPNGSNGSSGGRSTNGNGYGPWTGETKVKSGKWMGTMYKDLPMEVVQQWAERGMEVAAKELARRGVDSSPYAEAHG